mmetsp:Transcript_26037/g.4469  ORF Transcript_26037/g.4469 Transcript_26037/m.4469 type:complete len:93 (+) Transcript_26037:730-1008(+)
MDVNPVVFYPKNEGESATYVFSFTPIINIEVDQTISVLFPPEFAIELGENLLCRAEGLLGEISCKVTNSRTLDIRDFERFIACNVCQITLYV